jgi:hypothetical protein
MQTSTPSGTAHATTGTADGTASAGAQRHGRGDWAIRWTTTASVVVLAGIAALESYEHMFALVQRYGETTWTAAVLPVSVDGMIVASSMTLLADSRRGRRSGVLPWTLLVIGSAASLAANVAVAEPSTVGRLIAAWPSAALIGSYELLMGQIRRNAPDAGAGRANVTAAVRSHEHVHPDFAPAESARPSSTEQRPAVALQRRAWQWALSEREATTGALPSGKVIADHFGRRERWGRLVKQSGLAGRL